MKSKILALVMSMSLAVSAAAAGSMIPAVTSTAASQSTTNVDGSSTVTTQTKSGNVITTKETTTTSSKAKFVMTTTRNELSGETNMDLVSYDSTGKQLSETTYELVGVQGNTVKLTSIVTSESTAIVPETIVSCGQEYIVYKVGSMVLVNNDSIKKLVIGKNIIAIGEAAFTSNKNLKTITINSDKIDYVGENAFDGINKKAVISIKADKKLYKHIAKWIKLSGIEKTIKYKRI